ncbi:hypothetical protein [Pyruvatibacter sp.]|uniref:hypothetical protein n=1 Tax=Pyruvatibacter sp. TaxID=1981328 RepID=UPI0032663C2F
MSDNYRLGTGICIAAVSLLYWTADAFALGALDEWNTAARDAMPLHIKAWLGLMMLNNLAALAFVKNHVAARWVFVGFFVSHMAVMVMWWQDITVLAGQVSLFHIIFWTPGAIAILATRREMRWPSAYGVWASLVLLFYVGSMLVDIGHALTFLQNL